MAQTQLTQTPKTQSDNYTFVYCTKHKEGFMIKGYHKHVPNSYMMNHSNECDKKSWIMSGIIHYDGTDEVKVTKSIRLTYNNETKTDNADGNADADADADGNEHADEKKCFRFLDYRNTLTDEIGEKISIPINSPLYEWFNTIDGE
jgi:hypothetical protein